MFQPNGPQRLYQSFFNHVPWLGEVDQVVLYPVSALDL